MKKFLVHYMSHGTLLNACEWEADSVESLLQSMSDDMNASNLSEVCNMAIVTPFNATGHDKPFEVCPVVTNSYKFRLVN